MKGHITRLEQYPIQLLILTFWVKGFASYWWVTFWYNFFIQLKPYKEKPRDMLGSVSFKHVSMNFYLFDLNLLWYLLRIHICWKNLFFPCRRSASQVILKIIKDILRRNKILSNSQLQECWCNCKLIRVK